MRFHISKLGMNDSFARIQQNAKIAKKFKLSVIYVFN